VRVRWAWAFGAWTIFCVLLLLLQFPYQGPAGPCPGNPDATKCVRDYPSPLQIASPALVTFAVGVAALAIPRFVSHRLGREPH
jgi:hypothetical protein